MDHFVTRIAKGAIAGLVGTLAMDLLWWARHRRDGGTDTFMAWEFASGTTSFEEASAPGQVGQRMAGMLGVDLPDEAAALTTNVVHWLTGLGYGVAHGMVNDGSHPLLGGIATGVGAFANSYATLGALGIYEPIWDYEPDVLGQDFSAHLVFGAATGLAHAALSGQD